MICRLIILAYFGMVPAAGGSGLSGIEPGMPGSIFLLGPAATAQHGPVASGDVENSDGRSVILEMAEEKLRQHFSPQTYRFRLKARWIPGRLLKQKSPDILAVELEGRIDRYTNFDVLHAVHGQRKWTQIQLIVEAETKVPVVGQRLRRGHVIKKEDLKYQWVSWIPDRSDFVEDMDRLCGKTLRRTLLSGQPVRPSYISRDYVVEAGDPVKVIIKQHGIQVQVTGEARENGAIGDRISIYSKETKRKYVGQVVRPGLTLWKKTF